MTILIITIGRILYGEKKYSSNHTFRRPYGCAGVYITVSLNIFVIVVLYFSI